MPRMIRVCCVVLALSVLAGCTGHGVRIYPPEPADPADPWPRGMTGPDCSEASPASCREVRVGTGDPLQVFSQVTVRVTVEDTNPPATHGPVLLTYVYPPIDTFPFRGRNWSLTTTVFADGMDNTPFFARGEATMLGGDVIGMRVGGTRRFTNTHAGKLGTLDLPPGQVRHYTISLVQVCYPELWVGTRLPLQVPTQLSPLVTIKGCGHQ